MFQLIRSLLPGSFGGHPYPSVCLVRLSGLVSWRRASGRSVLLQFGRLPNRIRRLLLPEQIDPSTAAGVAILNTRNPSHVRVSFVPCLIDFIVYSSLIKFRNASKWHPLTRSCEVPIFQELPRKTNEQGYG